MVGWLIAVGLVLLILAVLLLPFKFRFDYDDFHQNRFYRLSWLGIPLLSSEKNGLFQRGGDQKKPEKASPPKKKRKKKKQPEDPSPEEKRNKRKQYGAMAKDAMASLPKPLRRLWKGFFVRHLTIGIQVGRFDAKDCAVAYGAANAALYTSLGLLQEAMHVQLEQAAVQCAFGQEKNRYVLRGTVFYCPLAAVMGALSFLIGFLWKQVRRRIRKQENS